MRKVKTQLSYAYRFCEKDLKKLWNIFKGNLWKWECAIFVVQYYPSTSCGYFFCHNNGFFKVVASGSTGGGFQIPDTWLQILPSLFSPLSTQSNWELARRLAIVNKVRLTALYLLNDREFMQQDGRKRRMATGLLLTCFVVLFTWH